MWEITEYVSQVPSRKHGLLKLGNLRKVPKNKICIVTGITWEYRNDVVLSGMIRAESYQPLGAGEYNPSRASKKRNPYNLEAQIS